MGLTDWRLVPSSSGFSEANDCHNPPGPGGGRFCSVDVQTPTGTLSYPVVKRVKDAIMGFCPTCKQSFEDSAWSWTKSVGLHQRGTGHKTVRLGYPKFTPKR